MIFLLFLFENFNIMDFQGSRICLSKWLINSDKELDNC
jgi:hypothetical protein